MQQRQLLHCAGGRGAWTLKQGSVKLKEGVCLSCNSGNFVIVKGGKLDAAPSGRGGGEGVSTETACGITLKQVNSDSQTLTTVLTDRAFPCRVWHTGSGVWRGGERRSCRTVMRAVGSFFYCSVIIHVQASSPMLLSSLSPWSGVDASSWLPYVGVTQASIVVCNLPNIS
jgi:hypothetical protein